MLDKEGMRIDMADWLQFFTFDVVGELAFGKNFGLLESGQDSSRLVCWVYIILSSKAALGWTWLRGIATRFRFVRWILNRSYLQRVHKRIEQDPRYPLELVQHTAQCQI